jgi:hypothetical protein
LLIEEQVRVVLAALAEEITVPAGAHRHGALVPLSGCRKLTACGKWPATVAGARIWLRGRSLLLWFDTRIDDRSAQLGRCCIMRR